jgi:hypothetical protein
VRSLTLTNNFYSYAPPLKYGQLLFQQMLMKVGVRPATCWVTPSTIVLPDEALVICGQFGHDDSTEVLEIVSEGPPSHPVKGDGIITHDFGVPFQLGDAEVLTVHPLNPGTYRLRRRGQTNDLAVIRVQ